MVSFACRARHRGAGPSDDPCRYLESTIGSEFPPDRDLDSRHPIDPPRKSPRGEEEA